jgi:hypothetical protein
MSVLAVLDCTVGEELFVIAKSRLWFRESAKTITLTTPLGPLTGAGFEATLE